MWFTNFQTTLNTNQFNSFTPTTPVLPSQRNILTSTFLEDSRSYNNRTPTPLLPRENGGSDGRQLTSSQQLIGSESTLNNRRYSIPSSNDTNARTHLSQPMASTSLYTTDKDGDETASLPQEKTTNPFATNSNSTAINFGAHLQKSKSLFSSKSYLSSSSRSLSNYRMRRQPSYSSSLYRSTSSLCDNNSTSSNASSALTSPFYNGQTTFGGASASSKRFSAAFQPDMQLQSQHRSKVSSKLIPSNLSKSTSSLNVSEQGTSCLSTTAKRILDLMNQFNTPLGDVRRVSSGLPLKVNSTLSSQKKAALLDVDTSIGATEIDKMKRKLLKPNTPYNRPVGRAPTETCISQQLNVPSMSQLLQLKKLSKNTMQLRDLATKSKSVLNQPEDYKLPSTVSLSNDLEVANNNNNIVNDVVSGSSKHVNKIRSNIIKSRTKLKASEDDSPPEPLNLPTIQLPIDKNKGISFSSIPLMTSTPSITSINSNTIKFAQTISPSSKNDQKLTPVTTASIFGGKAATSKICTEKLMPIKYSTEYSFTDPIFVNSSNLSQTESFKVQDKQNFRFNEPIVVVKNSWTDSPHINQSPAKPAAAADTIKFESHIKSRGSITSGSPTFSFGAMNKTNTTPVSVVSTEPKNENSFTFSSPLTSTNKNANDNVKPKDATSKVDDVFKSIAAKQNQGKWECSSCLSRNDTSSNTCAACGSVNKLNGGAAANKVATQSSSSGKPVVIDDVFKKFVDQQKSGSWECGSCLTRNNVSQKKCLCCNEPQPSTSNASSSRSNALSNFNFGTTAAVKPNVDAQPPADDLFKAIAAKQKSSKWVCTSCETHNDVNKSKCMCCEQARETESASSAVKLPASSQFSFGNKTNSSQFTFGTISNVNTSNATTGATDQHTLGSNKLNASESKNTNFKFGSGTTLPTTTSTSSTQFSFGSNLASKTPTTTAAAVPAAATTSTSTITTTAPEASPAPKLMFGSGSTSINITSNSETADRSILSSKPQFSFGTISNAPTTFGSFSFGSANKTTATSAKPSEPTTTPAVTSQPSFSFSSPSVSLCTMTATSTISTVTTSAPSSSGLFSAKPATTSTTAEQPKVTTSVPADDLFKKIIAEQKAKWECKSCMTKNDDTKDKCVACEAPKSDTNSDKKQIDLKNTTQQFNFGLSSTPFSFGTLSKPTTSGNATPHALSTVQFGTTNKLSVEIKEPLYSAFSQNTSTSTPSLTLPAVTTPSTSATTATTQPLAGFKFTFGSPASLSAEKAANDTTDGGATKTEKHAADIKVIENVLIKPATNGPLESETIQHHNTEGNESLRMNKKRTCPESFFKPSDPESAPPSQLFMSSSATPSFGALASSSAVNSNNNTSTSGNTSFVFGQSNLNTNNNNTFGGIAAAAAATTPSPIVVPKSIMFGSGNSSITSIAATPPTLAASSFSFNASASQSSPFPAPITNANSIPTFGGSSFSSPNQFGTSGFSFGSSVPQPTFGNPSPATNLNTNEVSGQ